MATCKDCIHDEVCNIDGYIDADECACFKNKSDYAEVKHGEWIECSNELNKYCSICKKVHGDIYYKPPYCPHCGARMNGRSDT